MSDLTNVAENTVVDWLLRGASPSLPASWHVALLTAVSDAETGSVTEVAVGGYARQAVTRNLASWSGTQAPASTAASSGTSGRSSNNGIITFGPVAAGVTVTHFALYDAATGGSAFVIRALTVTRALTSGDSASFAADTLALTVA